MFRNTAPMSGVVSITDNVAGVAFGEVTFTFTFSEAVTGFDATKVTVANGAGSLTSDEVILFVVPPRGIRRVGHYGYGRRGGWHRYGHKHVELHRRPGGVGLAGAVAERR